VENNKKGYRFTLHINDPANIKNYYMVNARSYTMAKLNSQGEWGQSIENIKFPLGDRVFDFLPDKQSFVREPFDISNFKPRIFSDETFQGKQYGLNFFLEFDPAYDTQEIYVDRVEVFLMSISKEMFEGLKSQFLFQVIRSDLYAEKPMIYSNMSNGIGLWAGYSTASRSVKLNKRVMFKIYQ
jgi:hypothetical protein